MVNLVDSEDEESKLKSTKVIEPQVLPEDMIAEDPKISEMELEETPQPTDGAEAKLIENSPDLDPKTTATVEPDPFIPPTASRTPMDDFQAKEDELNEYLKAHEEPGRQTLAERLRSLPNYQSIINSKPSLSSGEGFIEFTLHSGPGKSSSQRKGIQTLMDRFLVHTTVTKKPKEKHFAVQ